VVEVGVPPSDLLLPLGALLGGFLAAAAPLLAAGYARLRLLQRTPGLAMVARVLPDRPVRRAPIRRAEVPLQPGVEA
jgi:hypothetical protein